MARPKPATFDKQKTVAENRRARFDYHIEDKFEAGIALQGTEVKSLRAGEASIAGVQAPARQASLSVHLLPSSLLALLLLYTQPAALLHESVVQPLPSSQLGGLLPEHDPPAQTSTVVHLLPS